MLSRRTPQPKRSMTRFAYNVRINFVRNAARHLDDPNVRRLVARSHVKLFLAPTDGGLIGERQIPEELVSDSMIDRYLSIEPPQVCVMPEFDAIVSEIERAYALGLFFSALSAACVTIERVLNLLRIGLHPFHPGTADDLATVGAIPNWNKNIDALVSWGYLKNDDFTTELRKQYRTRSKYLHSGPLADLPNDAFGSVSIVYDLLKRFLGFPSDLFIIGPAAGIECRDSSHPLFQAFYRSTIVSIAD